MVWLVPKNPSRRPTLHIFSLHLHPSHTSSSSHAPHWTQSTLTMRTFNNIGKRSYTTTSFPHFLIMSLLLSSAPAWAGAFNCRGRVPVPCHRRRTYWSAAAAPSSDDPSRFIRYGSLSSSLTSSLPSLVQLSLWDIPRGGGERAVDPNGGTFADDGSESISVVSSASTLLQAATTLPKLSTVSSLLKSAVSCYAGSLTIYPILTKSITAGVIFGFSDWVAQVIEQKKQDGTDTTSSTSLSSDGLSRIVASFLVGTLFFGPAAHAWFAAVFALLPSTTLLSTLAKAALGQVIFGPLFTCVYFLANMLSRPSGFQSFTFSSFKNKIVSDLPSVWKSGLGYWPLVDLIGYGYVKPNYMPLYVNGASFVWTVYLSGVTNKK